MRRVLHCEYMNLLLPLSESSSVGWQQSTARCPDPAAIEALQSPACTRHLRPGAFTLIELLVVIAVIAILAALSLSTLGYANRKGAESRARAEVVALSSAIEAFKLDTGAYPPNAASLYTNLCPPSGKVYYEPTPRMLASNGASVQFVDPWDDPYGYSNSTTYFDLWSTAGDTNASNSNNWIRN